MPDTERGIKKVVSVKITNPILYTFLIPVRSAHRPTGNKNMAVESKKAVTTQLSITGLRANCLPMEGNAIFTDEKRKVPRNEVSAMMGRIGGGLEGPPGVDAPEKLLSEDNSTDADAPEELLSEENSTNADAPENLLSEENSTDADVLTTTLPGKSSPD